MADGSVVRGQRPAPDVELQVADRWLQGWGEWARGRVRLGLPTRSVIGRVIEEGALGAGQRGPGRVPVSDQAEAVERVIVNAPPRIKAVAIEHYVTHPHDAVEAQARRLGTSRVALYGELAVVRAYCAGALFGGEDAAG